MLAFLVVVVLIGLGERIGARFVPKYLEALGGTAIVVGLYGALENIVGALWSLPGGVMTDRLGPRRALLVFNAIAISGYLLVVFVPAWPAVLAASCLFLAWSALSLPATLSFVSRRMPKKRALGVSFHSMVRRVPMALGPMLGGLLIARFGVVSGVRYAFTIALVFAVAAIPDPMRMAETNPTPYEPLSPWRLLRGFRPELRRLLVSDILIRFCEQIPNSFVVLWVMNVVGKSAPQFGWLSAIEMATAMAIYLPVAHFSDRAERKPFVLLTFIFFTLFPAALWFARGTAALVFAFVLRGLKEFGEPTRKALIYELGQPGVEARSLGAYYLMRDLTVSIGAFAGGLLWTRGPGWNLWVAFGCGVIGSIYFALFGRGVSHEPATASN
ncbi:MAG: MFS transporter [Candidatus Eisenbacteria bacterium]